MTNQELLNEFEHYISEAYTEIDDDKKKACLYGAEKIRAKILERMRNKDCAHEEAVVVAHGYVCKACRQFLTLTDLIED